MKTPDPPSYHILQAIALRSHRIPFMPVGTSPVVPVFGCTAYFGEPINDPFFYKEPPSHA